jgi:LEA14-like dessication related protein
MRIDTWGRAARLGAALVAVAGVAGCRAAVERVFTPPTVALRGVQVTGVGLEGAALGVTLAVANPNPYPLAASSASYRLLVGDSTEVGRGTAAQAMRVGGHDSSLVVLPVTVSWAGLGRAGRGALQGGTVDYRVVGEVVADTPIGARTIPIDARGRFAAPRLAR